MLHRTSVVAGSVVLAVGLASSAETKDKELEQRVTNLEQRAGASDERFTVVEKRLSELEGQVATLSSTVASFNTPFYADVDCDNGQTIGEALQKAANAPQVMLRVWGICHESVRIARDNVSIAGQPGAGIHADAGQGHALAVSRSRGVWASGLSLQGGYSAALEVSFGEFVGEHLAVSGGHAGVIATNGASVGLFDCTIESSDFEGVRVTNSLLTLFDCALDKNRTYGVWAQHAHASLSNVTITNSMTGVAGDQISVIQTSGQYTRVHDNQVGVRLKLNSVGSHVGAAPDVSNNATDFLIDASSIW